MLTSSYLVHDGVRVFCFKFYGKQLKSVTAFFSRTFFVQVDKEKEMPELNSFLFDDYRSTVVDAITQEDIYILTQTWIYQTKCL